MSDPHANSAGNARQDPPMPPGMVSKALYHIAGALPLRSWNADGPTLYALTVLVGASGESSATLAGPAISAAGITDAWPRDVRERARGLLAQPPGRRAGGVAVFVALQEGATTNCAVFNVPPPDRPSRYDLGRGTSA